MEEAGDATPTHSDFGDTDDEKEQPEEDASDDDAMEEEDAADDGSADVVAEYEAAAATPVPKRQAKPDAVFEAAVVQFLKQNGSSPLSKVGNACKRPAGLSVKLKAFLRQRENLFHIDGDRVGLV